MQQLADVNVPPQVVSPFMIFRFCDVPYYRSVSFYLIYEEFALSGPKLGYMGRI